jgi:acetyl-CoA synthetase
VVLAGGDRGYELEFFQPWKQVVDLSRGPEWATWFVGRTVNIAWNCVHRWAEGPRAGAPAVAFTGEDDGGG